MENIKVSIEIIILLVKNIQLGFSIGFWQYLANHALSNL